MPDLFCCPLHDVDDALLVRYRELLSADEQQRLPLFKREAAAQTFIVGRALLRTLLAAQLGCAPQSLRFIRDANDKPQLAPAMAGGSCPLQFNLSHSDDWIALAVSTDSAVGVDIETSVRHNNILGIAGRYFPREEFELLRAMPETQRAEKFCALWTVKEACVKWSGLGIGRALAGVGVQIDSGVIALVLRPDIAQPAQTPDAVLYALTPQIRLAAVGDFARGVTLQKYVPLVGAEKLALTPLARSRR
ncbi:MAG: 4'-phosphopantetheinyl transferase superfamily protein [Spongiibacteraceae bacterium]